MLTLNQINDKSVLQFHVKLTLSRIVCVSSQDISDNFYAWNTKADHVIVMPISVIFDAFRSSLVCFNIGPAFACSHIIEYCKWVLLNGD